MTTEANLEVIGYFDAAYKRRYPEAPNEAKTLQLPDGLGSQFFN